MSEKCNRACWNCWYDEFCDWQPAGDEGAKNLYRRRAIENDCIEGNS